MLARLFRRNWWVLGALVAGSLPLATFRFTLSVAAAGLLAIAGFHALHYVLQRAFRPDNTGRDAKIIMLQYYGRLTVIGLIIFALMRLRLVDVFGLLLGLSVVVINLLALAVSEFCARNLSKEAA